MKKNKKSVYNDFQVAALAKAFRRSTFTIRRWELNKDDRLQSDKARETLKKAKALIV
jgi:hypothetical protein